ncbi:hypothetical protein CBS101457_001861 [Exobasidium rhododendri]|nr:hypothetical protein CBS101457_001861 [Exobasidium rhododendri]
MYAFRSLMYNRLIFLVHYLQIVNIVIDAFVGLIPFVGDALDIAFKANLRNVSLLEDHFITTKGSCSAGRFNLAFPPSDSFLPSDSPQRQREMPNLSSGNYSTGLRQGQTSQRTGWASTSSSSSSSSIPSSSAAPRRSFLGQYFREGTMKKVESGEGKRSDSLSLSTATIVPNEIFTTMRYEQDGIGLSDMCTALPVMAKATLEERGNFDVKLERQIPLLDRHLSRLQLSTQSMKAQFAEEWRHCQMPDREAIQKMIVKEAGMDSVKKGPRRRMRVSIDRLGTLRVESFAMSTGSNTQSPLTARLDVQPVELVGDKAMLPFQHKTDQRGMYDSARQRVNANLGMPSLDGADSLSIVRPCFDVLMLHTLDDKRLVLTESSIANILLQDHRIGLVFTPVAADRPLLSGLMRQELLAQGLIVEKDLLIDRVKADVRSGDATLYLCNALRGIISITLVD